MNRGVFSFVLSSSDAVSSCEASSCGYFTEVAHATNLRLHLSTLRTGENLPASAIKCCGWGDGGRSIVSRVEDINL
ncbi:hypothetical protein ANCCAN_19391 [Ancylostoma caninum]|uniref:Uncharacterized protein n=1 Tax=Ancylostoma caninum TaxID=29170 RepID=A0A368FRH3_ANCCA|nr:hypothetical protein ANCCAN_19391 [Ancylostoma caninum]